MPSVFGIPDATTTGKGKVQLANHLGGTASLPTVTGVQNGVITNAMLSTAATQPGGAWDSWTPTATNFNTGAATLNYAQYKQVGKTVVFRVSYTLTGAAVTGAAPTFTLPVTSVSYTPFSIIGGSTLRDTGTAIYFGNTVIETTTTFAAYTTSISGSFTSPSALTATSPFTWANTDILIINGTYQAA